MKIKLFGYFKIIQKLDVVNCLQWIELGLYFFLGPRAKMSLEEKFKSSPLSPSRSIDSQLNNLSLNLAMQSPVSEQKMYVSTKYYDLLWTNFDNISVDKMSAFDFLPNCKILELVFFVLQKSCDIWQPHSDTVLVN